MDLNLRINIDLAKPANYIPMGFWVQPVAGDPKKPFYRITDLGIPMVKVSDGSALGYSVYVLNVDVSNDVAPSATNPQWRLIESTELIYIQQAFIERLWTQMLIAEGAEIGGFEIKDGLLQSIKKDNNNNPLIVLNGQTGKVISNDSEVRGIVYATGGEFDNVIVRGSSRSPFRYCPDSTSIDYTDNVVMLSDVEHGWLNPYSLPWDLSQSGRRITIVNYKWGETIAVGSNFINAPSGKYFFEDGVNKSRLYMRTQAVELLGYGDDTTFYGWIVLSRKNLFNPNFETGLGSPINFIAYGTVYGNNTGATMSAKTFDGYYPSVSRLGEGRYKITIKSSWFSSSSDIIIMATGLGYSYGSSSAPVKATVTERTTTYFVVDTSDDDSRNDGSFMFLIMNYNDWLPIQ